MAGKCLQRAWKAGNPLKEGVVLTGRRARLRRFVEQYRARRTAELAAAAAYNRDMYERGIAPRRKRTFLQKAKDFLHKLGKGFGV